MKKKYQLLFMLFIIWNGAVFAQANPIEIIAKFQPEINILDWQKTSLSREDNAIIFKEVVSKRFNLALLSYDASQLNLNQVEDLLGKNILWVSPNHSDVVSRTTPNDTLYSSQWGLADIAVEEFWDVNTNGLTFSGDTIVVAIMESGTSINHPDLLPNFWHNNQEIPNDGIDNDDNGYVDDFLGWNSWAMTDQHPYDSHGARVAGVIGAKGDNVLGIAGVNWNIKMMPITFVKANFATYFKAFDYLIDQRQLYNETNGQKGALIVAVNESFGQDDKKPDEDPNFMQWCEYMDALGEVGILTVAATSNAPSKNVDTAGDMPTTCPQEHLIAVTNIAEDGTRYGGYGPTSIDLAAPGTMITTTNGTNSFSSTGGTSFATPHVTGAVALIYSYPCERWSNFIKSNPKEAALQVKKWILTNTAPTFALENRSVSEGRLNFTRILEDLEFFCEGNKLEPLNINFTLSPLINGSINFTYDLPEFGDFSISIFNLLGQKVWSQKSFSDNATLQEGSVDVGFLAPGMYVLMISQGDSYVVRKFIQQKTY